MKRYVWGFDLLWFGFVIPIGLLFAMFMSMLNGSHTFQSTSAAFGNGQELTVSDNTQIRASACEDFVLTVNAVPGPKPQSEDIPATLRQVQPFADCGPKLFITPPFYLQNGDLIELQSGSELYLNVEDNTEVSFSRRLNEASRNEINRMFLLAGVVLISICSIFSRINYWGYKKYLSTINPTV